MYSLWQTFLFYDDCHGRVHRGVQQGREEGQQVLRGEGVQRVHPPRHLGEKELGVRPAPPLRDDRAPGTT